MSIKTINNSDGVLGWILFFILNFAAIVGSIILLLTTIPNPFPLILVLVAFGFQIYYFRASTTKLVISLLFLGVTIWLMEDTNGATAVSLRCAPEIRKPVENRDVAKVHQETEKFESCLNSITFTDYVVYGLLKK